MGSYRNPNDFIGDNFPVVAVTLDNVREFIKKLNEKEGTDKSIAYPLKLSGSMLAGLALNYSHHRETGTQRQEL